MANKTTRCATAAQYFIIPELDVLAHEITRCMEEICLADLRAGCIASIKDHKMIEATKTPEDFTQSEENHLTDSTAGCITPINDHTMVEAEKTHEDFTQSELDALVEKITRCMEENRLADLHLGCIASIKDHMMVEA